MMVLYLRKFKLVNPLLTSRLEVGLLLYFYFNEIEVALMSLYYKDVPVEELKNFTLPTDTLSVLSVNDVGKQFRFYDAAKVVEMRPPTRKADTIELITDQHLDYIKANLLYKAKLISDEPDINSIEGSPFINEALVKPDKAVLDPVTLAPTEIIPVTSSYEWLYKRPKKDYKIRVVESPSGDTYIDRGNFITRITPTALDNFNFSKIIKIAKVLEVGYLTEFTEIAEATILPSCINDDLEIIAEMHSLKGLTHDELERFDLFDIYSEMITNGTVINDN